MYVKLTSDFKIGNYHFRGCTDCEISKSIWEYQDKGFIKLPTSAVVKREGAEVASSQTEKVFKKGDKVAIQLGYDGKLKDEFKGFVSNINNTSPCTIELEGYSYILRNKKNIVSSWKSTTVKDILAKVIEGTEIKLHPDIPNIPLKNIRIDNATGIQVLDYLKDLLKDVLVVYFIDEVLYAGLAYVDTTKISVKHRLGWNVISSDNLKVHRAEDVTVNVQFTTKSSNGQSQTIEAGQKGGIVKKETISAVTDPAILKQIAESKLKREQFEGYEGDFTTFLIPYTQPGYKCVLDDPKYPTRGGDYFVESVKVRFGQGGGRRTIQIGQKLSI